MSLTTAEARFVLRQRFNQGRQLREVIDHGFELATSWSQESVKI